ncbi:MAG: VWA domain-containing protein [Gammaproteobacteria bacterium]|nr:VWA domain-containing protein [Gammaproteobacteria bacterium]
MKQRFWVFLLSWLCWAAPCLAQVTADVVIVFDNSGSMRTNDPQVLAKDAVRQFIASLGPGIRVGLILFDQRVDLAVPLQTSDTSRAAAIEAGIGRINYRGQRTDIPAALERAALELNNSSRAGVTKAIVFLTDGIVDTGNPTQDLDKARWVREDFARGAADGGIHIYAISFTAKADRVLTEALAEATGGASPHAASAADLSDAFASVSTALTSLRPIVPPAAVAPLPAPAPLPVAEPATTTPAVAPVTETVPTPAPRVDSAVEPAAATVADVAPGPAAADTEPASAADQPFGVDDLTEEERAALQEAGVDLDEMFAAEPGKAIIIPPKPQEDRKGMLGLLLLAATAGALLVGVALWLRSRRNSGAGSAGARAPEAAVGQGRLDVRLRDVESITGRNNIVIGDKPLMIGRTRGNDENLDYLVVDRPTVGRRHALVSKRGAQYWLADQGSVNGTYLNDQRLTGERQLHHGDRLRLHKYVFEFDAPGLVPAATETKARGESTVVADAATLVGAAAGSALAYAERGGDTGIATAGKMAATGDWFSDTGMGAQRREPQAAPATGAAEAAALPRTELLDPDAAAAAFFTDAVSSGFDQDNAGTDAPAADGQGHEGLQQTVTTVAEVPDLFAELAAPASDAGPPTVEHDLSATPFLATSAMQTAADSRRPFADLDTSITDADALECAPGSERLQPVNPDLTVTDDDFEMFDVTGTGDDTAEGFAAVAEAKPAGERDHE